MSHYATGRISLNPPGQGQGILISLHRSLVELLCTPPQLRAPQTKWAGGGGLPQSPIRLTDLSVSSYTLAVHQCENVCQFQDFSREFLTASALGSVRLKGSPEGFSSATTNQDSFNPSRTSKLRDQVI